MRTTLDLDPALLAEAQRVSGAATKTATVELGLEALVQRAAQRRLAQLRGAVPAAKAPRRRRTDEARRANG
ncbi:MAG: type II toxin-antitoxin system VapB family antitoxin [Thermoanaerobaculia bacterium]